MITTQNLEASEIEIRVLPQTSGIRWKARKLTAVRSLAKFPARCLTMNVLRGSTGGPQDLNSFVACEAEDRVQLQTTGTGWQAAKKTAVRSLANFLGDF